MTCDQRRIQLPLLCIYTITLNLCNLIHELQNLGHVNFKVVFFPFTPNQVIFTKSRFRRVIHNFLSIVYHDIS